MNAPELAKYINERLVGPQKESDKPLTESAILTALRQNCPLCGSDLDLPCQYCDRVIPENVPNNDTKEQNTAEEVNK